MSSGGQSAMSEETEMEIEDNLLAWWLHQDDDCLQDCEYCRREAEDEP